MVDEQIECLNITPWKSPFPVGDNNVRCIQHGMGRPFGSFYNWGHWTFQEKTIHNSVLELKVILLALRSFLPYTQGSNDPGDNRHYVRYVLCDQRRGAHLFQLCAEVVRQWHWCILHNIYPMSLHLAGESTVLANCLSRDSSQIHEWFLKDKVVQGIFFHLGQHKG